LCTPHGESVHIPDGYLSVPWIVGTYTVTLSYLSYAWRKVRGALRGEKAAAASVLAAAIFAAQMLNWPLPGGTSLHFVGGALAGILFGPWVGSLILTLVVTTQCLVFHDGGITALGANILNMGIVATWTGYLIYKLVRRAVSGEKGIILGSFLAGWLSIAIAGAVAGIEIGLSPSFPYGIEITVPVMFGWHFLLGIIEGIITASVVYYLVKRVGWEL